MPIDCNSSLLFIIHNSWPAHIMIAYLQRSLFEVTLRHETGTVVSGYEWMVTLYYTYHIYYRHWANVYMYYLAYRKLFEVIEYSVMILLHLSVYSDVSWRLDTGFYHRMSTKHMPASACVMQLECTSFSWAVSTYIAVVFLNPSRQFPPSTCRMGIFYQ